MCCQLADTFIKPRHILHHAVNLCLDKPGLFMHACIAQDRPHGMQNQHQIIRSCHIDTPLAAFIDDPWQLQIDLGIDGFRRQEHDGTVGGFARHDIALGNISDVLFNIGFQRAAGLVTCGLVTGFGQAAVGLQRKFGINTDGARRVGHFDKTIDAFAIAKRVLKAVGAVG